MKQVVTLIATISLSLALLGCSSSQLHQISVAQANSGVHNGYRLAPGDRLKVNVFNEASLSGEYEIGLDGNLPMPLVGKVAAAGKSSDEIAGAIVAELVKGGYVLEPRIAVEVLAHRPFYILGEVKTPGEYPHLANLTLEQAIAKAGGYTPRASKSFVILRRQEWNEGKRVLLDGANLEIAPGDTISVPEAFF